MEIRSATTGQIKQLHAKLIMSAPSEAWSHDEAERMLRDASLWHRVAVLLRCHNQNKPIRVVLPEDAVTCLAALGCKFFLQPGRYKEASEQKAEKSGVLHRVVKNLSHSVAVKPTESLLEVISLEWGPFADIRRQLQDLGYRPATADEAAGFLQARGKTFCNLGRGDGHHGFEVIGITGVDGFMHFVATPPGPDRYWEVHFSAHESDRFPTHYIDVLVAKL